MRLLHEFEHEGRHMRMYLAAYSAGRHATPSPAVQVTRLDPELDFMEIPYGRLTVNLHGGPRLGAWRVHVKTWSENEDLAAMCMATGVFSELDMPASAGHTQAATWSIRPERIRLDALDFAIGELGLIPSRSQALTVLANEYSKIATNEGGCIQLGATNGQGDVARLAVDHLGRIHCESARHMGIDASRLDKGPLDCTIFGLPFHLTGEPSEDERAIRQMVSGAAEHIQRLRLQPDRTEDGFDRPRGQST